MFVKGITNKCRRMINALAGGNYRNKTTAQVKTIIEDLVVSYPNFIRGPSFANILILASRIELLNASCRTICKVFRRFGKE